MGHTFEGGEQYRLNRVGRFQKGNSKLASNLDQFFRVNVQVLFAFPKWEEQVPAVGTQSPVAWCKLLVARVGQGSTTLPTREPQSWKILALPNLISDGSSMPSRPELRWLGLGDTPQNFNPDTKPTCQLNTPTYCPITDHPVNLSWPPSPFYYSKDIMDNKGF